MAMQKYNPPARGMSAAQYYSYLVRAGMPQQEAMADVQRRYGPMKTKEELAKDADKNKTVQGIAAAGGMIGGYLVTDYVKDNIGNWINKITGKQVFGQTVLDLDKATGQFQTGNLDSGSLGLTRPVPDVNTSPGSAQVPSAPPPKVIEINGETATIELPNGSTQEVPAEAMNDAGFLADIDWGKVIQGAAGVAQLYGAYKSFKAGDKVGGTIGAVGGTTGLAASGALGEGASTAAGEALGGYLIPGAQILAGVYGGYKTAEATGAMAAGKQRNTAAGIGGGMAGLALGAGLTALAGTSAGVALGLQAGVAFGPIGMAIGAAAGYLGSSAFGSHKGKAQFMRDGIRTAMQENKLLDENWMGTLADGSKFDFGQDGSHLKWKEIDKIAAAQPTAWNGTVPLADALAASYGFVGQKASDIAAWYARGAVSNAGDDAAIGKQNMQHFAQQQGITFDAVKARLDEAMADNRINQTQYDYYLGGAKELTAGVALTSQNTTQAKLPLPKKGEVLRLSPGVYQSDSGKTIKAPTMKEALQAAYNKTKEEEEL